MQKEMGRRFHFDRSFFLQSVPLGRWELYQIGELCLEPTAAVEVHSQRCMEFSYIISGEGWFEHDGNAVRIKSGDLIFSPDRGEHAIRADDQAELFYAYVGFRPAAGEDAAMEELLAFFEQSKPRFGKGDDPLYRCFRQCGDEFNRNAPTDFLMAEACLTRLILSCVRRLAGNTSASDYTAGIRNSGQLMYRVLKFIDDHCGGALGAAQVAAGVGYSPCYLSHLFKEKMGRTLQDYILVRRIDRAKELMALRRFTISEIADRLGWTDLQSFSRAFKRQTGCSPSQYMALMPSDK